ncbi:hypothetical protein L228DRAFT_240658 [Xylona heveae TC161]|uniref:SAGA-associated factor 11 n=1 Tax=Xylona heveae (strain CBS 132557 / TC161) TaxID=1328760 RepID=A0A165FGB4_XYLHT|nr:hypothetical protein L228DRAFT_240658 [Xylona heveae TC161]KZF20942.1 hypothetical protein L228DRAFT_240658 [Xylona heveae TC161]
MDDAGEAGPPPDPSSMAGLVTAILNDCLQNIIHDIVLKTHREEKLLRMQSAAIIAEQAAIDQGVIPNETNDENNPSSTPSAQISPRKAGKKVETPGAVYDNGKIYLKGNPLETTKDIYCPSCKLPRLLYPASGVGSKPPEPGVAYCTKQPYITKPGHDIYGNPFPSEGARTKKDAKSQVAKEATPGSFDSPTPPEGLSSTSSQGPAFPNVKCPVCSRSLIITRYAQHLEKCMGISGRQSSRNAMAKLNSQNSTSGTPFGSRMSTPVPAPMKKSPSKRAREEAEGDDEGVKKKKVLKKFGEKSRLSKLGEGKEGKGIARPLSSANSEKSPQKKDREGTPNGTWAMGKKKLVRPSAGGDAGPKGAHWSKNSTTT